MVTKTSGERDKVRREEQRFFCILVSTAVDEPRTLLGFNHIKQSPYVTSGISSGVQLPL